MYVRTLYKWKILSAFLGYLTFDTILKVFSFLIRNNDHLINEEATICSSENKWYACVKSLHLLL